MVSELSVFEETYRKYLVQISETDLKSIETKLGIQVEENKATIPFFNQSYTVSAKGIVDPTGKQPRLETSVVLCNYLLRCPDKEPLNDDWVSYRDFKDSGPLTVFFANAVEKPVADHFSGRVGALEKSCHTLGGFLPDMALSYELSMQFSLLPRISPYFYYLTMRMMNFRRTVPYSFERRAEKYLDAESLAILGMLFSVCLKKADKDYS